MVYVAAPPFISSTSSIFPRGIRLALRNFIAGMTVDPPLHAAQPPGKPDVISRPAMHHGASALASLVYTALLPANSVGHHPHFSTASASRCRRRMTVLTLDSSPT